MKARIACSVVAAVSALTFGAPALTAAAPSPSPKPKISIAPQTLRAAKYKQDTMIKRSQRHSEATSGTTASSENPANRGPQPAPSPHR